MAFSNGSGCCFSGLQILDLCFQLDSVFIKVNFVQYIQILFVCNFTSGSFLGPDEKLYIPTKGVISLLLIWLIITILSSRGLLMP